MHKVITTTQLEGLLYEAVINKFNCASPNVKTKFRKDAKHVLFNPMLHNDQQIRCSVMAAVEGTDNPLIFQLDIAIPAWNLIPEYKEK